MPYTPKQHKMFEAAAHNPSFAAKVGIPVKTAKKMASEVVKKPSAKAKVVHKAMDKLPAKKHALTTKKASKSFTGRK